MLTVCGAGRAGGAGAKSLDARYYYIHRAAEENLQSRVLEKLIKEDICDEFADALFDFYVKDGGYLNLYANYIRYEIHMNEYCGTLTAEEFKVFEHVLNENAGLR